METSPFFFFEQLGYALILSKKKVFYADQNLF